jgi:hypothetical protein
MSTVASSVRSKPGAFANSSNSSIISSGSARQGRATGGPAQRVRVTGLRSSAGGGGAFFVIQRMPFRTARA